MTRLGIAALLALLALAACGADGEPETPPPPDGISVSGDARFGVSTTF